MDIDSLRTIDFMSVCQEEHQRDQASRNIFTLMYAKEDMTLIEHDAY